MFARSRRRAATCNAIVVSALLLLQMVEGFQPSVLHSGWVSKPQTWGSRSSPFTSKPLTRAAGSDSRSSTSLSMFMGSDGGVLGIGTPELFLILLVGYFVLGPSDLYKIVKSVGSFVQNIRTVGTDLTSSFENNMESQLQLTELRKAQAELTDAFSFRRSINANPDDPFEEPVAAAATTVAAATATADDSDTASTGKKKKIRRRVKRKTPVAADASTGQIPDLEMPAAGTGVPATPSMPAPTAEPSYTAEEEAEIEKEFEKYTSPVLGESKDSWSESAPQEYETASQSRFQAQMSGDWNQQVLTNEDTLAPLATVMNKIALLEKEKRSATERLDEEFRKRAEIEEDFYKEQRRLLEEAANQIQDAAVGLDASDTKSKSSSTVNI